MDSYIADWLNLTFRWLHLITGAAWIGTSFYFNWLNHSIRKPENPSDEIDGELFSIHGGHFYRVMKYKGAPEKLPDTLHWFKWEAYFTWITGICLLSIVYYLNPIMMANDETELSSVATISIGFGSLIVGWVVYDLMCKSPLSKKPILFTLIGFGLMVGAAYLLTRVLSFRAAYIHIGAMLGTMMAANVFFVIIPNQRKMVDAMMNGDEPDVSLGAAGALRSFHNNYFTLPVLFIMISNHYPMTFGHQWNWAILAALSLIGAGARHYFNLKHKGHKAVWILPTAAFAMFALAFVVRPSSAPKADANTANYSEENTPVDVQAEFAEIKSIIDKRCLPCHAKETTDPLFPNAQAGIKYDTPKQIKAMSSMIKAQAVDSKAMPFAGNKTGMTDEERAKLGAWIENGSKIP